MKSSHNDKKQFSDINEFLKETRFLKLTNDAAFKAYFKSNKQLLISLLTSFLPLPTDSIITDIEILDPELHPEILSTTKGEKSDKNFILDLRARLKRRTLTGSYQAEVVNVEMQAISEPYFMDRSLAYSCRLYSRQIEEGSSYDKLFPVYSLAFINENLKAFKPIKDYYHICNIDRREFPEMLMLHGLCFVIVELGKFDKNIKQLYNTRESWCYLLKNSYNVGFMEYENFKDQGGDMAKAVQHLWNLSQDEILREYLEAIDKKKRDRISRENFIREENRKIREEARRIHEEGLRLHEEGLEMQEEGLKMHEEGLKMHEEGLKKEKQKVEEIVLKLLHTDMSVEKIPEITGVSKEHILQLQKDFGFQE